MRYEIHVSYVAFGRATIESDHEPTADEVENLWKTAAIDVIPEDANDFYLTSVKALA
jgi:hypothetical protein